MYFFRSAAILALFVVLCGCGASVDTANTANTATSTNKDRTNTANSASGNAEELGMLINFTLEPEDLTWKADEKKKTVIAVFRLDAADINKFAEQLSQKGPGVPKQVTTEEWFPAELTAQGEVSGGSSVDGVAYPANEYFQAPYEQGTITRVNGTDFFVIELSAK